MHYLGGGACENATMGLCCTQWPYVADGPARVPRASTKRECVLIVYKHIEKTAGTTLVQWFHELARRGDLTYHSRYFHATGQCATCRSRGNGTANWTPSAVATLRHRSTM